MILFTEVVWGGRKNQKENRKQKQIKPKEKNVTFVTVSML